MHIGLNGQQLLIDNPAGPEKYTYNLFKAIAQIDHENDYTIYFKDVPKREFFGQLTNFNPRFTGKTIKNFLSWTQVGLAKELLNNPVDIYFSSVHTIPIKRKPKMGVVGMIHGLEYKYSSEFKNPIRKLMINKPEQYVIRNSDAVIVPSNATKQAIMETNWIEDDEKINIIYEGVGHRFFTAGQGDATKVKERYNINFPYIIFVSTIQPRKNLPNTIAGFSHALKDEENLKDYKVVVVGKKGWDFEESYDAPQKFGVEDNIVFLGRVPDEDLPALYKGADAFVNLSFEEGFGLPLVEAMAAGIPCLVSDIPAFREVGRSIPIFVDPNDIEKISDGFISILRKRKTPNFIEKSQKFANKYSWEKTAEKTLRVFKDVFEKHHK